MTPARSPGSIHGRAHSRDLSNNGIGRSRVRYTEPVSARSPLMPNTLGRQWGWGAMTESRAYGLMPWVWGAAWMLTGVGAALSDIYSSPGNGPAAYLICGAIGWGAAAYVTASAVRVPGASAFARGLGGWIAAYLVAVPLGLLAMVTLDLSSIGQYWAVPVASGLGGAIGGLFTPSASQVKQDAVLRSACWGAAFFASATVSVYAFYTLALVLSPFSERFVALEPVLVSAVPAAFCGIVAGFIGRRFLGVPGLSNNGINLTPAR
jgi:hypothetical protein